MWTDLGITDAFRNIQHVLKEEGLLHDYIDGVLGPNTFKAIREFQQKYGLPQQNGVIDKATLDSFFDWSSRSNSPINDKDQDYMRQFLKKPSFNRLAEQVMWFQTVLHKAGYCADRPDGLLRPEILDAVHVFQEKRGIPGDRAIGYDTLLCAIELDLNRLKAANRRRDVK